MTTEEKDQRFYSYDTDRFKQYEKEIGNNFQPYPKWLESELTKLEEQNKELVELLKWAGNICADIQRYKTYGVRFPETALLGVEIEEKLK